MKYYIIKFKKQIIRIAQLVAVFGVAVLVLLYFLGYYDFSFLDRYRIFDDYDNNRNDDVFSQMATLDEDSEDESESETDETDGESSHVSIDKPDYEKYNVSKVWSCSSLLDKTYAVASINNRVDAGYTVSQSAYYSADSVLGRITFDFKLPEKYSLGRRLKATEVVVYPEDDGEPYTIIKDVAEYRPALETYMGYILMDSGDDIYLLSSDGKPLSKFAYNKYLPAYARDNDGNPLFMKTEEDGTTHYFTVSDDGKYFVYSDFDPDEDGVGLRFDYPATFGKSDSTSVAVDKMMVDAEPEESDETETETETESETDEAEESEPEKKAVYGYVVRNADGSTRGLLTEYKFTSAHAFTSNRAAVTEENNRGAMYFINENGRRAFDTVKTYLNEYNRYVTEYMLPPLTKGVESMGFFYFDNGLTRVRKQTIDYYNFEVRETVRVVEDKTVLIRTDGSEYTLPAGFTLAGYSEGMILLERDGKFGFMSAEGEWIAQPIYSSATPFIGGLAVLEVDDGRFGMIDREGNIVLPFTYDSISQNSSGVIAAYREENGWSVFRVMEKAA